MSKLHHLEDYQGREQYCAKDAPAMLRHNNVKDALNKLANKVKTVHLKQSWYVVFILAQFPTVTKILHILPTYNRSQNMGFY